MFTDWVTISYGKIDQRVWPAWVTNVRLLQERHLQVYTMRHYGNMSIVLPGQYWQSLGLDKKTGHAQVASCLRWSEGAHVTRFDLAHDFTEDDGEKAKQIILCRGDIDYLDGRKGWTIYIGDRKSGRFARLYNKRDEIRARTGIDIGFPLVRFEAEMKKEVAPVFYKAYLDDPQPVVDDIRTRYGLGLLICGDSTDLLRIKALPAADPFAFVRRFEKAIGRAAEADPRLFAEMFPVPDLGTDRDTVLPPVTSR